MSYRSLPIDARQVPCCRVGNAPFRLHTRIYLAKALLNRGRIERMITDFLFPSSILCLKFLFKVSVNREFERVTFFRTVLLFPIDVVFLSFTFMAAVLVRYSATSQLSVKSLMTMILWIFVLSIVTTICSLKSEAAFIEDKNCATIALWGVAVFTALIGMGLATFSVGVL